MLQRQFWISPLLDILQIWETWKGYKVSEFELIYTSRSTEKLLLQQSNPGNLKVPH